MQQSKSLKGNSTRSINDYAELIETIARIEYNRLSYSSHLIEYSELVNIGAMAVHIVLTTHKGSEYNISYISTAIKWAIRNELRRRYKWYTLKHQTTKDEIEEKFDSHDELLEVSKTQVREAIYETILSIDDLAEAENPTQVRDTSSTPDESLEIMELNKAVKAAIKNLPPREKMVLETRFFKNKKIKDIAADLKISSSRVSRIIQSGLDKVRLELKKQELV